MILIRFLVLAGSGSHHPVEHNLIILDCAARDISLFLTICLEQFPGRIADTDLVHGEEYPPGLLPDNVLRPRHAVDDVFVHKAQRHNCLAVSHRHRLFHVCIQVSDVQHCAVVHILSLRPDCNLMIFRYPETSILHNVDQLRIGSSVEIRLIYRIIQIQIELSVAVQVQQLIQLRRQHRICLVRGDVD